MKQMEKKKPRVFRTLIRRIRAEDIPQSRNDSKQTVREKNTEPTGRPPFFFGR